MADVTKTGGNATRAIVIVGGLLIVALVGVIVALVMLLNRPAATAEPEAPPQRATLINEDNIDETMEELVNDETVPTGYYEVTMNTTWNFPDGQSPATDAYVENSTANTNDVYFDISLRNSGDVIYESPVIPVGQHISNITLSAPLPIGSYDCVCTYYLLDENQNVLSNVSMGMTINVLDDIPY